MNTKKRIQNLLQSGNYGIKSVAGLERHLGISNGTINKWDKATPNGVNLKKVSDYFGVTTDYLLGNTDEMRPADNRSVEQKLSDEGMAIATYIDPNAELDEQAMDNIKNYIYEQTMLAKMRIDKERAENGK